MRLTVRVSTLYTYCFFDGYSAPCVVNSCVMLEEDGRTVFIPCAAAVLRLSYKAPLVQLPSISLLSSICGVVGGILAYGEQQKYRKASGEIKSIDHLLAAVISCGGHGGRGAIFDVGGVVVAGDESAPYSLATYILSDGAKL